MEGARVGVDYDVDIGGHYDSVQCQHARIQVDLRDPGAD